MLAILPNPCYNKSKMYRNITKLVSSLGPENPCSNTPVLTHLAYIVNGEKNVLYCATIHLENKLDVTLRHFSISFVAHIAA